MSSIAVQGLVGGLGSKATTELSYSFSSLVDAEDFQYGTNENGIYLLNTGETDSNTKYTRTFTLATTDLGDKQPKRGRFFYVGVEAEDQFTLSVKFDDQEWKNYTVTPNKTGLQRVRVPIGKDQEGRYVTVKVTSTNRFRIDSITGLFIVRPIGSTGY